MGVNMIDFGGLTDLLGGAGDIIQEPMASIQDSLPINDITDTATGAADQISEAGSGISDSISSLLP